MLLCNWKRVILMGMILSAFELAFILLISLAIIAFLVNKWNNIVEIILNLLKRIFNRLK
jgi:hypothetical protein